jgi:hypothetical protein
MKGYMEATLAYREGLTRAKPRHVCPLLEDNACSVWTVRPIVCRGVNSTDVEACIRKREDPINDPPIPQIVGQFYAAMYSRTGMRYGLKKHGLDSELVELIPALMIALQDPSAGDRYLSGEPIFAGAKVTGREV